MKINFSTIEVPTLEGKPVTGVHKLVANLIYQHTKNLDMIEKCFAINKGEEIEMSKEEIEEVKRLLNDENSGVAAFVKKYTIEALDKEGK